MMDAHFPQGVSKSRHAQRIKNKCDYIVDQMMEILASEQYPPGSRLPPESYFVELFDVSRVTIRESFKKLSMMGVVSIRQGEGTFVNKVTPAKLMSSLYPLLVMEKNNVFELYEARRCIEIALAELATRNRVDDDLRKLHECVASMEQCVNENDIAHYNHVDRRFHIAVAEAAKNSILLAIYMVFDEVRNQSIEYCNDSLDSIRNSLEKHRDLADAIEFRDEKNVSFIVSQHLNVARKAAMEHLTK